MNFTSCIRGKREWDADEALIRAFVANNSVICGYSKEH